MRHKVNGRNVVGPIRRQTRRPYVTGFLSPDRSEVKARGGWAAVLLGNGTG